MQNFLHRQQQMNTKHKIIAMFFANKKNDKTEFACWRRKLFHTIFLKAEEIAAGGGKETAHPTT